MENTNEKRLYSVAEIQLTYKSDVKPSLRPKITGSKDAYNILLENWDNSKIEFVELRTRKLLEGFGNTPNEGSHRSDSIAPLPSMTNLSIDHADSEQLFEHFENLSRSIYLLEQMKLSLRDENAFSVMQLLNDDNYLKVNDLQINEILNLKVRVLS